MKIQDLLIETPANGHMVSAKKLHNLCKDRTSRTALDLVRHPHELHLFEKDELVNVTGHGKIRPSDYGISFRLALFILRTHALDAEKSKSKYVENRNKANRDNQKILQAIELITKYCEQAIAGTGEDTVSQINPDVVQRYNTLVSKLNYLIEKAGTAEVRLQDLHTMVQKPTLTKKDEETKDSDWISVADYFKANGNGRAVAALEIMLNNMYKDEKDLVKHIPETDTYLYRAHVLNSHEHNAAEIGLTKSEPQGSRQTDGI